jgi:DNA invertase Pin-like site-specific DNA recombinase
MRSVGYIRIKNIRKDKDLREQKALLKAFGCNPIIIEVEEMDASAPASEQTQLQNAIHLLEEPGDALVIARLPILKMPVRRLQIFASSLLKRNRNLISIEEKLDTSTSGFDRQGFLHSLYLLAQLQKHLRDESTRKAIRTSQRRNPPGRGIPTAPELIAKILEIERLRRETCMPVATVCKQILVPVSSYYRIIKKHRDQLTQTSQAVSQ